MTVVELLHALAASGVELWFEGERLRFRAPKGALTNELRNELGARRAEVLAQLRADASTRVQTFPLSYSQRSLWFVNQEDPESAAYNVGFAARVVSAIDVAALRQALQALVDRHAALRTSYPVVDGLPVQSVAGTARAVLELHQVEDIDEAELRKRVDADYRRPFNLATGQVFRTALYSRAVTDHVLLINVHHIAADGWSLLQLLDELRALYAESTGGPPASAARPEAEYTDFTRWQGETLAGAEGQRLADYWRRQLAAPRAEIELPADRRRPARRSSNGATYAFELDAEVSEALRNLARSEATTLFVVLLAAFKTLLFRYTGTEDVIVGTPTFGRNRPEFARVIGDFVNIVALRSKLDPALPFRELLARMRQTVFDALDAQDFPFPLIVEQLQPVRDPSRSPLFENLFVLQRFDQLRELEPVLVPGASVLSIDFGGLRLLHYRLDQQEGQFDLTVQVVDCGGALAVQFKYNVDLFDAATIERMRDHFRTLTESVVASPALPISRLPMLSAAERDQVLVTWSSAACEYPRDATIPELFDTIAARRSDAIAVASADASREVLPHARLTYGELGDATNRLAARLRIKGVQPGMPIGLYVERSVGAVVALLAILRVGAAYVPLDTGEPPARTVEILRDGEVGFVLTQRSLLARLSQAEVQTLVLEDEWQASRNLKPAAAAIEAHAGSLAYVMFTSGTTGKPKGVCVTHRNIVRLVRNTSYANLGPDEVILQLAPLAFDASTFEIWGALLNGGLLVVYPCGVPTARELAEALGTHGITILWLTAGFFHYMVESEVRSLARVRQVLAGGDVLSTSHVQRLLDAKRDGAVVNGYGPTENTTFTCCHRMTPGMRIGDTVPIGRPIANTRVYILDPFGEPAPIGVAGELFAGGDGVARGYLADAAMGADRFIPDPFDSRAGAMMYRTGDLARWRGDGTIEFMGRRDRQVKVRGFRVELGTIEDALRTLPGIGDAAVIAQRDVSGVNALIGYVVPRSGKSIDPSDVRNRLTANLPDYMIPGVFVVLPVLPLNQNGKLDRNALPAPGAAACIVATEEYQAPETETEKEVAQVFAEVLNVPAVGLRNNFFELGGHSLLATRALTRLRERFEIAIPMASVFHAPTVEGLSRWLDAALKKQGLLAHLMPAQGDQAPRWKCLVPAPSNSSRPPLFMITGYMDEDDTLRILSNLIPHLGPDRPLCGIRPRWLDGRSAPYSSVAEMRDEYLEELRAFQPKGPYYLLGDCVGGVVAIEMARTLLEQGDEVALLVLLDTERPRPYSFLVTEMMHLWDRGRHVASVIRQIVSPTEGTRGEVISAVMRRKLRRAGVSNDPITATDYIYQQRIQYQRLLKRHKLKRYPGRVRLIVSDDVYRFVGLLGWNGFADGGVEVSRVPGSHQTFRAQYSREFGQQLRICIDQARSEHEKRVPEAADSTRGDEVLRLQGNVFGR